MERQRNDHLSKLKRRSAERQRLRNEKRRIARDSGSFNDDYGDDGPDDGSGEGGKSPRESPREAAGQDGDDAGSLPPTPGSVRARSGSSQNVLAGAAGQKSGLHRSFGLTRPTGGYSVA